MIKRVCFILFFFLLIYQGMTQTHKAGETFRYAFSHAPFPDPGRSDGHHYQGTFFPAARHYQDSSVLVYVPLHFSPSQTIDVVVHFHGWGNEVEKVLSGFDLARQMDASGRNCLLVLPQGPKNALDSYGGNLERKGEFSLFIQELMDSLRTSDLINVDAQPGNIILSGHSGGYRVMAFILAQGGMEEAIQEAWLFDGLYSQEKLFMNWLQANPTHRLVNMYTDHGGTKSDSEAFLAQLRTLGTPYMMGGETALTDAELSANRIVFLHSDLGHNEVMNQRRQFQRFLTSSPFLK